ncbi:MAG: DegV family protein, partial [Clostridia bacterium]|nr:DegV family protein [Clostridia bacterium]
MKVHIIVDSTVDLLPEIKVRTTVVPLTVHFGEEEYIDGVTITHQQFYEKLVETDILPRTSQANPDAFASVFAEITAAGDSAVVITVSSSFSGTYQSAIIAAVDYDNVHVVDSRTVAIGAGILAKMALEMADLGFDAPTIAKTLDEEKKKIRIVALVDTLEYLKKGGRISKTV